LLQRFQFEWYFFLMNFPFHWPFCSTNIFLRIISFRKFCSKELNNFIRSIELLCSAALYCSCWLHFSVFSTVLPFSLTLVGKMVTIFFTISATRVDWLEWSESKHQSKRWWGRWGCPSTYKQVMILKRPWSAILISMTWILKH